jgi:pimeloyl-ACP methyl ester carboxylesterase
MSTPFSEAEAESIDGTRIGLLALGSGPPLVFVHGGLTTGDEWRPVAAALADRFTCLIMSRRGRGRSGDAAAYSLDKECQDIQAVLNVAGVDACLVGHSYGALCALEAARRFSIGKLVLYEPPLPIDASLIGPAFAAFRDAVAGGRFQDALLIMLRDLVHLNEDQLASLRSTPVWSDMAALTPSAKRELEVIASLELGVERFGCVSAPTLLLVGTETAAHHKAAASALQQTLPNARTVLLERQGHEAHVYVPDVLAGKIGAFLCAV